MAEPFMSFAPDDLGHGLFDDARGKIVSATCENWQQTPVVRVPALHLTIQPEGEDAKTVDQYWSAGKLDTIQATDDLETFRPIKSGGKVSDQSNAGMFFKELVGCASDREAMIKLLKSGKASNLVGLDLHWNRKSRPKVDADSKDLTILLPTKVYSMGTGPQAAAPAAGNGAAADSLKSEVEAKLLGAIAANDGSLPKSKITSVIFKEFEGSPSKGQALQLAISETFLKGVGSWKYDGKNLTI